jgi:prepilin-type N-terminal cleavage/methylation domain-containing protein
MRPAVHSINRVPPGGWRPGGVRGPGGRGGFSLIEVMVAILILGIALAGLTHGISTALGSGKESELQTTAALFAAGQIEQLRAAGGLTDKTTEGDFGEGMPLYRWKQSVTAAGIDGLHEVEVIIEDSRNGKAIYELRTLLFERSSDSEDKKDSRKKGGAR